MNNFGYFETGKHEKKSVKEKSQKCFPVSFFKPSNTFQVAFLGGQILLTDWSAQLKITVKKEKKVKKTKLLSKNNFIVFFVLFFFFFFLYMCACLCNFFENESEMKAKMTNHL